MKKVIYLCDRCDKEAVKHFEFCVDRQLDGAGDTDDVYEDMDLCSECMGIQLDKFIAALQQEGRKNLAVEIKKHKKIYIPRKISNPA